MPQVAAMVSNLLHWLRPHWYLWVDFFPYQLAVGVSLRWFEAAPHLRLYAGPFRLAAGGRSSRFRPEEDDGDRRGRSFDDDEY